MAICSAETPKMLVFCYIQNQQKIDIFVLKCFNEKIILNPEVYIYSEDTRTVNTYYLFVHFFSWP